MTPSAQPTASARYSQLLRRPHVLRLLTGAVVGHLPVAMAPLALLLAVRTGGGSVRQAGVLTAVYGVSAALGQPWWGRLLDRHGQHGVLTTTALASTLSFAALAALRPGAHPAGLLALTAAAGWATPPLEAALRVLWPEVTDSSRQLRTALGLDAAAQEVVFIAGPLLVLLLDTALGARTALAACAVLVLGGTLLLATAPPARTWMPPGTRHTRRVSPLRLRGPRVLAAALFGAGIALGAMNIVALELAETHHTPALSTLIPAALAAGSLTGGLVYGRRTWSGPPTGHLLATAGCLLGGLLPTLVAPPPLLAVLTALLPGLFLAPLLVQTFAGLDQLAPQGTLGEAAAWMIASLGLGQAAGSALAGAVGGSGPLAPAAVTVAGAAGSCLVLAAARRTLTPPVPTAAPRQLARR
ncbi:MFS transporter [Streptomyces sp. NPDC001668]|uniref:MFS transporter n=1 Tax=Streptomyces sp. NPDC001668 TaxID=3364598 RepID=UPI0036B1B0B8